MLLVACYLLLFILNQQPATSNYFHLIVFIFCCEKKLSSRFILNFISTILRMVFCPSVSAGTSSIRVGRCLSSRILRSDAVSDRTRYPSSSYSSALSAINSFLSTHHTCDPQRISASYLAVSLIL